MAIVTDLSKRERDRYVRRMQDLAESCTRIASALASGDDQDALTALILVVTAGSVINELCDVFVDAAHVTIPDHADGA
jgi:hypothetical protein